MAAAGEAANSGAIELGEVSGQDSTTGDATAILGRDSVVPARRNRRKVTVANTFRVLMWQHCLYYRRNKTSLVFSIIMPPIFAALMSLVIYNMTGQGPFASWESAREAAANASEVWNASDGRERILLSWRQGMDANFSYAHDEGDITNWDSTGVSVAAAQAITCGLFRKSVENHSQFSDPSILFGSLYYFPTNNKTEQIIEVMWRIYKEALQTAVRISAPDAYPINCTTSRKHKFRGFETKEKIDEFIQEIQEVDVSTTPEWISAPFFAIVDLTNVAENQIVFHNSSREDVNTREAAYLVQAAMSIATGGQQLENISVKYMPNLGERIPEHLSGRAETLRTFLPSFLTVVIAVSGLSMSVDLVVQLVHEKESGFQSYLVSIGVSPMFVATTWVVTGMGIGVITSIVEFFVLSMNSVLSTVNPAVVFFVVLLYNLSQLSMALFLSTLLKTRNHVVKLLLIVLVLCITTSLVAVQVPETFAGPTLARKRAVSLIPAVNVKIAFYYLLEWRLGLQKDVSASHLSCSPYENDASSALAECIAFLVVDVVFFLFLAFLVTFAQPKLVSWRNQPTDEAVRKQSSGARSNEPPAKGIVLENVTKNYGDVQAISSIDAHFPEGKITVLLGENGAGKSTTMNIVAGLQDPTTGCVLYDGESLRKRKTEIQDRTSYLPQADMYYPYLTLREHIVLFARIRGMEEKDIETIINTEAPVFDLTNALQAMGRWLSGGQKRKLGLMISYIVEPKYIILDEVTTGVDPYSARAIWMAILAKRGTSTTIISTHNMDEAEALADHIVVLSQGINCASGSPGDLKDEYGSGFNIVVSAAYADEQQKQEIEKLIREQAPTAEIRTAADDIAFKVDKDFFASQEMLGCLKSLEDTFDRHGTGSYGINGPSLQQVFFSVTQKNMPDLHQPVVASHPENTRSHCSLIAKQIGAILHKRLLQTLSSPLTIFFQFIVPIAFVVICAVSPSAVTKTFTYTTDVCLYQCYRKIIWFSYGAEETLVRRNITEMLTTYGLSGREKQLPAEIRLREEVSYTAEDASEAKSCILSGVTEACHIVEKWRQMSFNKSADDVISYHIGKNTNNLNTWLYSANQSYPRTVVFGLAFDAENSVTILSQEGADVTALNAVMNAYLKSQASQDFVHMRLSTEITKEPSQIAGFIFLGFAIAFLALAVLYSVSDCQTAIVQDADTDLKEFMFTTKLPPWVYWTGNLMYDMTVSSLTVAILASIFCTATQYTLGPFVAAGLSSVFMAICYTYLANAVVRSRQIASKLVQAGTSAIWVVILMQVPVSQFYHIAKGSDSPSSKDLSESISATISVRALGFVVVVLRFIPAAALSELVFMLLLSGTVISIGGIRPSYFNRVFYGEIIGQMIGASLFYFTLLIMTEEWNIFGRLCRRCLPKKIHRAGRARDPDVQTEKRTVEGDPQSQPIAAVHLMKTFRRMPVPSVDDVTFAVKEKECFGLLGVNGAGKTTTFRMLLGLEAPSAGNTYVKGINVQEKTSDARKVLSYCAQNFTTCDYLTVEQHIRTFAALQGQFNHEYAEAIAKSIGLEKYRKRKVGDLSGGNKKRVQFMCAMMANPEVMFLDEPTSGMDPAAQRQLWQMVKSQVEDGSSVLLTSHNMFECENLCDRITIMVKGQLRCIGTIQYLKNKLGNRYTVSLRFPAGAWQQVQRAFEDSLGIKPELTLAHSTGYVYEVDASALGRVSQIFEAVAKCRQECGLEGFSVSQLSLENVFVSMAERM